MGLRSRHVSEYFVVLQKRALHAARTWRDHAIPDVWEERAEKAHPHSKPIGMQERLIRVVTQPGELVVDPAAGGYSVLESCTRCDRNFCGCDIEFGEEDGDERSREEPSCECGKGRNGCRASARNGYDDEGSAPRAQASGEG